LPIRSQTCRAKLPTWMRDALQSLAVGRRPGDVEIAEEMLGRMIAGCVIGATPRRQGFVKTSWGADVALSRPQGASETETRDKIVKENSQIRPEILHDSRKACRAAA